VAVAVGAVVVVAGVQLRAGAAAVGASGRRAWRVDVVRVLVVFLVRG